MREISPLRIYIMAKKLSQDKINQIISLYKSGLSYNQIAKIIGCSTVPVWRYVHEYGLIIRSIDDYEKKYTMNSTFFRSIDQEDKSYWLGFLSADGNIRFDKKYHQVCLGVCERDGDHIKKFQSALRSTHPIKYRSSCIKKYNRWYTCCFITICSKLMVRDLVNLGVTSRKSLTIKPCSQIPDELERHYWRGFIDGDGTLTKEKNCWRISLVGTYEICAGFKNFLIRNGIDVDRYKIRRDRNIYQFRCGGKIIGTRVANLLYENSIVYLDRKYELYKKLVEDNNQC